MEQQKAQIGQLQEETASAQDQSLQQQAKLSSLQEEQQQAEKIAQIQKRFSPNEANVIQENGKVVIRLKGLHFPSSKATISSKDYNLLNQVSGVLREFEGTQIAVEGHTDSKGSKQANLEVSEKRAEAVKDYLLAQNAVAKDNVKTEGKGFNQPIATNKTKEGRAQNRRVDIILDTAKG
jgi:outer membrane protein OmpA-like peptidoglycan-associated protein